MAPRVLIHLPETARPGEVIEIRAMIAHDMETGQRRDSQGRAVPRHIIERFVCLWDEEVVFTADFFPAIAANPYVAFTTVATGSGTLSFAWTDDRGHTETVVREIAVV